MSDENPNNTPGWRNKLDELEHLPGSIFNNDAAWEKLHGRLQGNKKNKKVLWYWVAAACLLVGLVITILNYQKTVPQPLDKQTVKDQSKKINTPVVKVEADNKNKNENIDGSIKDKIVSVPNKPVQKNHRIDHIEPVVKIHDDIVINHPEQEPLVKPLQIINNNSTTAAAPPKKKLKVVHINELGDPIIQPSDVTRIEDIHSFQFKFANGEVLSNSSIASKPSGVIILKTKPSTN